MVQRLRARVAALEVTRPHVLIACSAGQDSVALAATAAELYRLGLITAELGHVHHGQHAHADAAVDAVQEIGTTLGMPVHIAHLKQADIDAHEGVGIEEALRRERYLALATFARQTGATVIATGHHQRDQAETLLLRLTRGTGLEGLAGMREVSTMSVPWWSGDLDATSILLWRPFLSESPDELVAIARASGLPVVDDPSNDHPDYRRNEIRHRVLPLLEEIAPGAIGVISRTAGVLAGDLDALEAAEQLLLDDARVDADLDATIVRAFAPELQARVIRRWLIESGHESDLTANRVHALCDMVQRNRGGSVIELGQGVSVELREGRLRIRRK